MTNVQHLPPIHYQGTKDRPYTPSTEEWNALNETSLALVHEFNEVHDSLTAESAAEIARRFFELQRSRLAVQEEYFALISEKVSPVIAVQFSQLHRRFDLEIQRATSTPLAE